MGDRAGGGAPDGLEALLPAHCSSGELDTWDRHLSIAFSSTKGLRNAPGENNCFVNCAVQVFWHLDVFRRSYRRLSGHTCMGNSCIFCALKVIFTQFQYSDKSSLHPDALRKALAETFANQQRFQLGHMDDAAECFENILRRLHFHVASNFNEDMCTAAHCLPHRKFSMDVQEKVVCVCGATTSPLKFHEMVHYVSASALLAQSRLDQSRGKTTTDRFGLLLRTASAMGDVRNCPALCGKQVQKQRTLMNIPDVVSVGLVWDSDRPSMETTTEVARILGTSLLLTDMYHHVAMDTKKLPLLQLVAVVCYYGKHYSTFVLHSKLKTWIYFDDSTVREIGPQWANVVEKCSRGRFQPLLLLYANDKALPVSVDSAPQRRVMATGYTYAGTSDNSTTFNCRLSQAQESIRNHQPQTRRDPIPTLHPPYPHNPNNPQLIAPLSPEEAGPDWPRLTGRDHVRQPSFLTAMSKDAVRNKLAQLHEGGRTLPGGAAMAKDAVRNKVSELAEGGRTMPGGATMVHKPSSRRQLLDGGANSGHMDPMVEEVGDYADYTLSSADQHRRPDPLGVEGRKPLLMSSNPSRNSNTATEAANPRKVPASWKNGGKEKVGVDVVRYQADPRLANSRGTADLTSRAWDEVTPGAVRPTSGMEGSTSSGRGEGVGGGVDLWIGGQHVVVKPTPTPYTQHDLHSPPSSSVSKSHTPVQSGLATLPRFHRGHDHHHQNLPQTHLQAPSTSSSSSTCADTVTHHEVGLLTRRSQQDFSQISTLPPGTPPPEYDLVVSGTMPTFPHQHPHIQSHDRQSSASSGACSIRSSVSMGTLHQMAASSSGKSTPDLQQSRTTNMDLAHPRCSDSSGQPAPALKKSNSEGLLTEGWHQDQYIDRRMVENILKHQGVHRHGSSCSNSSVDSDSLLGGRNGGKQLSSTIITSTSALKVDIPVDTLSLSSLKDSGCGSSDRHSSSSAGSGSVDQFPQFFLTNSMVMPRSFTATCSLTDQLSVDHIPHHASTPDSSHRSPRSSYSSSGPQLTTMEPIKESSLENLLKPPSPSEPIGTKKFIMATPAEVPHGTEPRPPPIPPKNFAQFQIIKSSHAQLPNPQERVSSLESLIRDENLSSSFLSLCQKAETLMDKCAIAESRQDLPSALHNGQEALVCLKGAMRDRELNSKAQAYLQRKYNTCLIKVHTLQKRAPASRQESHSSGIGSDVTSSIGNRSSNTSSDSDFSDQHVLHLQQPRMTLHIAGQAARHTGPPPNITTTHLAPPHPYVHAKPAALAHRSREVCAQESGHLIQRQGGDISDVHPTPPALAHRTREVCAQESGHLIQRQGGDINDGQNQDRQDYVKACHTSGTVSANSMGTGRDVGQTLDITQEAGRTDNTINTMSSTTSSHMSDYVTVNSISSDHNNMAEVYGTLPRNKSRNPGSGTAASPEMYQNFLNKQKSLQAEVRLSQQSLDTCRSDASSVRADTGSDARGNKPKRCQIRQLLEDSIVQRQWHQQGTSGNAVQLQQTQAGTVRQKGSTIEHRTYGQPAPSCQQPRSHTQQSSPPSRYPQHRQQLPASGHTPHSSGHTPHSSTHTSHSEGHTPHSAGIGQVSGLRASPPLTVAAGRPRILSCNPSLAHAGDNSGGSAPSTVCMNPTNSVPPSSGKCGGVTPQYNVARVLPYTHLQDAQVLKPCSGNSYLVMMHCPPSQHNNLQSPALCPGNSQGRPPDLTPLERSASQSDCRGPSTGVYCTDHGSSFLSNTVSKRPGCASLSLSKSIEHLHRTGTGQQVSESTPSPGSVGSLKAEHTSTTTSTTTTSTSASVRSLLSRFERKGSTADSNSGSPLKREASHRTNLQRSRSKSESSFSKPKSVLKKTTINSRPGKSVTFAESIVHCADDEANSGYGSATELGSSSQSVVDSRLNYSDDELRVTERRFSDCDVYDSSDSGDDCNVAEEEVCHLCHRRRSCPGEAFCTKCSFYLSKLNLNLT